MHHIFTFSDGKYSWHGDADDELSVCNMFVEWKIPHRDFPQIKCGASAHVFRLDDTGLKVFHDEFMPFFPKDVFMDFMVGGKCPHIQSYISPSRT